MRIAYPFSIILEHGLTSPLKDQFSRTGYQYIFFVKAKIVNILDFSSYMVLLYLILTVLHERIYRQYINRYAYWPIKLYLQIREQFKFGLLALVCWPLL